MTKYRTAAPITYLVWIFFAFATASVAENVSDENAVLVVKDARGDASADKLYDIMSLEAFDTVDIVTETPWTNGYSTFTGVLARDILRDTGSDALTVRAIALNDYSVEIPASDFFEHDVIFAFKMNGDYLTIRNRGPVWVIYPWSDKPELNTDLYFSRSIWQLRTIVIQ